MHQVTLSWILTWIVPLIPCSLFTAPHLSCTVELATTYIYLPPLEVYTHTLTLYKINTKMFYQTAPVSPYWEHSFPASLWWLKNNMGSVYFSLYCTFQSAEKTHCLSEMNTQSSYNEQLEAQLITWSNQIRATSMLTLKAKEMHWMLTIHLSKSGLGKSVHSLWVSTPSFPEAHRLQFSTIGLAATELGSLYQVTSNSGQGPFPSRTQEPLHQAQPLGTATMCACNSSIKPAWCGWSQQLSHHAPGCYTCHGSLHPMGSPQWGCLKWNRTQNKYVD